MPWPGESGAALRNLGIIRGLGAAGHELSLLTFAEAGGDATGGPLRRYCADLRRVALPHHGKARRLANLLTSGAADMEIRLDCRAFRRELGELLAGGDFDLVQFSGIELGGYLRQILAQRGGAKVVYDALNAEADLQRVIAGVDRGRVRRWPAAAYSAIQSRRLATYEARICREVDAVITVSDEDRRHLSAYRGAPIHVLPNGIDTEAYVARADTPREERELVFSGKMDYRPNVDAIAWFCASVLPGVRAAYPDVRLRIVGRSPHARIRAWARQDYISLTGRVASVLPHLQRATIYIAPLRMGSGTRLKILQAMAAGCAVVSTSIGAAGLNDCVRGALEIADEPDAFARIICELLADGPRRIFLGRSAQQQVRKYYDWAALMPRLLRAYRDMGLG